MSRARSSIEASRMQTRISSMIQRNKNSENNIDWLRQVRNDSGAIQKRGSGGSMAGAVFGSTGGGGSQDAPTSVGP